MAKGVGDSSRPSPFSPGTRRLALAGVQTKRLAAATTSHIATTQRTETS